MADPLDEFESEQAAKKQARANRHSRKQQTGEPPVLKKPMFGYEQSRQEAINAMGGFTIDGRKRNPKETIDAGPYKGMTPGEGLNAHRADYAASGLGDKQAATYRAEGGDIRTPQEVAAQGEFDRQQSLAMFGPSGSEPGRGNRMGKGGRRGQPQVAPSDPANPLTRPSVASAAMDAAAKPKTGGLPSGIPMRPQAPTSAPVVRSSGPMMTGDQFRQSQSQVAATGKSERMPVSQPSMIKPAAPVSTIAAKTQGATTLAAPSKPLSTRTAADIMGSGPAQGPKLPAFDRTAATAKATREVATLKSDAIAKANIAPADPAKKAAPIPDPSSAVRSAAKDFARGEVRRDAGERFGQVLSGKEINPSAPRSFLDSPQYAEAKKARPDAPEMVADQSMRKPKFPLMAAAKGAVNQAVASTSQAKFPLMTAAKNAVNKAASSLIKPPSSKPRI